MSYQTISIRKRFLLVAVILSCLLTTAAQAQGRPDIMWMRGGHACGCTNGIDEIAYFPDGQQFGSNDRISTQATIGMGTTPAGLIGRGKVATASREIKGGHSACDVVHWARADRR
jgi:hypothetical protein